MVVNQGIRIEENRTPLTDSDEKRGRRDYNVKMPAYDIEKWERKETNVHILQDASYKGR